VSKKGCSWWAVLILMIATFLVAFFWGSSAASQKPVSTPVSAAVPVAPVVPVPPKVEPVPEPVKADPTPEPVKTSEPEKAPTPAPKVEPVKADPTPKMEPVDIEGISDEAWKSARVVLRSNGSVMGVFLSAPTRTTVVLSLPPDLVVDDLLFDPISIKDGGNKVESSSWGMAIYHPEYRGGNKANKLAVTALGADRRFTPNVVDRKVSFYIPESRAQVFFHPDLGDSGFGNLEFSFSSNQKFVEMSDKKLFVRLYLEWMARHPSRETNTSEAIDLLRWWDSLHQSAK